MKVKLLCRERSNKRKFRQNGDLEHKLQLIIAYKDFAEMLVLSTVYILYTCSESNKFARLSPFDIEISSKAFIAAGCSSFFSVTWCSCNR